MTKSEMYFNIAWKMYLSGDQEEELKRQFPNPAPSDALAICKHFERNPVKYQSGVEAKLKAYATPVPYHELDAE